MFKSLQLLPVYDSSENDLINDLIVPLLSNSIEYFRGVGFFTSGWLKIASTGVIKLIENGGKAKFVMSPNMEKKDWEAIQLGEKAKNTEYLKRCLEKNIQELKIFLEKDTLNALAWMVADNVLEFKFAIPRKKYSMGDYHDKVGVFTDKKSDIVAFHGSFNDTMKGSLNGEAFSVFKSWESGQSPYVDRHLERLSRLYNGGNEQFEVYSIPQAIKESFMKLRSSSFPPYLLLNGSKDKEVSYDVGIPKCPVKLYSFQEKAVDSWVNANCSGIFEMATGTGKTFTSLAAAINRINHLKKLCLIILVPYLHLLEQWQKTCEQFGFLPILCSGNHKGWPSEVQSKIQDFNLDFIKSICIIAVHDTGASEKFSKAIKQLPSQYTLLIGDEVHALGASAKQKAMISGAGMRLGLSATPKRWFDDIGTEAIFSYFGNVCFEFTIENAIGKYLTPYSYNAVMVNLSADEIVEYEDLSKKIALIVHKAEQDIDYKETLKKLLIQRARLISSAEQKLPKLLDILKKQIIEENQKGNETNSILIYCAPGMHKTVLKSVSGLGLRCHEFVHTVSISDRGKILNQFAKGNIQVLVAVKCLDEGVDVPSTKTAFFLASTTNPKEFIQRRGRILRLDKGKNEAQVYDFIVVPEFSSDMLDTETGKSILKREMPRFAEFSSSAINEFESRSVLRDILDKYGMLHLMDEKPWEIYHKMSRIEKSVNLYEE